MQFLDAVKIAFKKYADFKGVASRPEFWWFTLFVFLVGLIAGSVDLAIGQSSNGPIQSILSIALFLPQITMTVRRNRDAGFSAWWLTLWIIPVVTTVMSLVSNASLILQQVDAINAVDSLSDEQAVQLLMQLLPIFVPIFLTVAAVSIFFLVVSLLPSKRPKQPVVASIDY